MSLQLRSDAFATGAEIPTTYVQLGTDVAPGNRILLDDGLMELSVRSTDGRRVECEVIQGGRLLPNKGLNLPGIRVSAPSLTEKDIEDLAAAIEADVDLVGLSFVQRVDDVLDLRERIGDSGPRIVASQRCSRFDRIAGCLVGAIRFMQHRQRP